MNIEEIRRQTEAAELVRHANMVAFNLRDVAPKVLPTDKRRSALNAYLQAHEKEPTHESGVIEVALGAVRAAIAALDALDAEWATREERVEASATVVRAARVKTYQARIELGSGTDDEGTARARAEQLTVLQQQLSDLEFRHQRLLRDRGGKVLSSADQLIARLKRAELANFDVALRKLGWPTSEKLDPIDAGLLLMSARYHIGLLAGKSKRRAAELEALLIVPRAS